MKISTKGRYALRLMLDLAANSQHEYTPVKEISLRQDISDKYRYKLPLWPRWGEIWKQKPGLYKAPAARRAAINLPKRRQNAPLGKYCACLKATLPR